MLETQTHKKIGSVFFALLIVLSSTVGLVGLGASPASAETSSPTSEFDNDGGGEWDGNKALSITNTPGSDGQYKFDIDGDKIALRNAIQTSDPSDKYSKNTNPTFESSDYSFSSDTPDNFVPLRSPEDGSVVEYNGKYWGAYGVYDDGGGINTIALASSTDLTNWTHERRIMNVSDSNGESWESGSIEPTDLVYMGDEDVSNPFWLFYNGEDANGKSEIGISKSVDMTDFNRATTDNPVADWTPSWAGTSDGVEDFRVQKMKNGSWIASYESESTTNGVAIGMAKSDSILPDSGWSDMGPAFNSTNRDFIANPTLTRTTHSDGTVTYEMFYEALGTNNVAKSAYADADEVFDRSGWNKQGTTIQPTESWEDSSTIPNGHIKHEGETYVYYTGDQGTNKRIGMFTGGSPVNADVYFTDSDFWSNVQSDGSDIRLADDGSQMDFWIENFDSTGEDAEIWVRLPAGAGELNMWYGNPDASSSSYNSGEQTFEVFDDFDGSAGSAPDSTVWNVSLQGSGSPSVEQQGDGTVRLKADSSTTSSAALAVDERYKTFTDDVVVEYRERYADSSGGERYGVTALGSGPYQDENGASSDWWFTVPGDGYSYVANYPMTDGNDPFQLWTQPSGQAANRFVITDPYANYNYGSFHTNTLSYDEGGELAWNYNDGMTEMISGQDNTYQTNEKKLAFTQGSAGGNTKGATRDIDTVKVYDHSDPADFGAVSSGGGVSVRVTTTDGTPVNDATVEAYRADEGEIESQLGSEIDSAEAEADRLMDEAADPVPDSYTEYELAPGDMSPIYEVGSPSGVYPTAHTKADMGLEGYVDAPDLKPRVSYESGESVYLYAWDPSDGDNLGLTEDGVTKQHVGSVDSDATFTVTKIDSFGDELETREVSASQTYSGGTWPVTFEHDYAEADLPDGYYRVSVKGSEAPGYVIRVGDAADLLETQLKNDAGELSDRAQNLQSNLDDGLFTRQRGVTDDTGVAQGVTLQSGEVAVQAYKGPDTSFFNVDDPSQITASDLRDASSAGYDGAIYIPTRTKRVNADSLGESDTVTVELRKVNVGQLSEMEQYEDLFDKLVEERLNETTSDLESLYRDRAANLSELESRHSEIEKLVENNEELDARVEEILDRERNGETEAELREEIDAMETAIAGLEETLESEEPESEIDGGELFAQFPFTDDLNEEAVTVMAHYEDGSSEVVSSEYWSVESASVLGGDQVTIDGYPVPADRAVADIEVKGVSEEGALGSSRDSIRNPLFSGDVPDVEAIDVSTLRPGVGDTVSMAVRSDDSSFNGTSGATVYDPNGNEVVVTDDADRLRWTPETAGDHTVRITYTNELGHEFVETFRLEVRKTATTTPPSLRVTDGIGGQIVLAGSGLESGSVDVVDGTAEITAQSPGGEAPSSVNIWAESISAETLDVRVVQGDYEQNVEKYVSLTIRSNANVDEAIVRRSGNALAADGSSKHGSYERRTDANGNGVTVIETYTDASGVATVEINNDPSLLERILYEVETISVVPTMLGVTTGTLDLVPVVIEPTAPGVASSAEVGA